MTLPNDPEIDALLGAVSSLVSEHSAGLDLNRAMGRYVVGSDPYENPQQVTYELWRARLEQQADDADPNTDSSHYGAGMAEKTAPSIAEVQWARAHARTHNGLVMGVLVSHHMKPGDLRHLQSMQRKGLVEFDFETGTHTAWKLLKPVQESTGLAADTLPILSEGLAQKRIQDAQKRGDHKAADFWRKTSQGMQGNKSTTASRKRKRPTPQPRTATAAFQRRHVSKAPQD